MISLEFAIAPAVSTADIEAVTNRGFFNSPNDNPTTSFSSLNVVLIIGDENFKM